MKIFKFNKVIIIGKTPPPIGGVTIHCKRLTDFLNINEFEFRFVTISKICIVKYCFQIFFEKFIIHLHTSSPLIRLIFSIFNKLSKHSIVIITYHGNIGRFNSFYNWLDTKSLKFSTIPIVLNNESYNIANHINPNTILIPAFIPPIHKEYLSNSIIKLINTLSNKKSRIFCTNAFNVSFDKNNNEIYCGTSLLKLFCKKENQQYGFIFSDPSGSYNKHIKKNRLKLTDNILIISEPHSFFEILKASNCFIRCTTTDGDPLSVKEALYLNKFVIASDAIKRPDGVYTFTWTDNIKLQELINQVGKQNKIIIDAPPINGADKIMNLYNHLNRRIHETNNTVL